MQTKMASNGTANNDLEFGDLLEEYAYKPPQRGEIIMGEILRIEEDVILMDVGAKRDAIVPPQDIKRLDQEFLASLSRGDQLPVYVLNTPDGTQELEVSINKGLEQRDWDTAAAYLESGEICELPYIGYNKGGMLVRFNRLQGFVPRSHVPEIAFVNDARTRQSKQATLVGTTAKFKVLEVDQSNDRLLFSERNAQEEQRRAYLEQLEVGQVIRGTVVKVVKYGAFVDIGENVNGLAHISELAWQHIAHPRDVVSKGEQIDVKILSIDVERERVALSRKALLPTPIKLFSETHEEGEVVEGTVTKIVDFGAFVEVADGVEGLVHQSEMGSTTLIEEGDEVLVRILGIKVEAQRLALSLSRVSYEEQIEWMRRRSEGDEASDSESEESRLETDEVVDSDSEGPGSEVEEASDSESEGAGSEVSEAEEDTEIIEEA